MSDDMIFPTIPVKTAILDQKIERVKNSIESGKNAPVKQREIKLKETCSELESLFISYLLKEMRQTIEKSGFISGGGLKKFIHPCWIHIWQKSSLKKAE